MCVVLPLADVSRDTVSREIRFEFCERTTRTSGVYDLARDEQEQLLLEGHLPGWGLFLPDFAIVYAIGTLQPGGSPAWEDMRVHVGGVQWEPYLAAGIPRGREVPIASQEWHRVSYLVNGAYRMPAAPSWLLDLIRDHTPWGALLDRAANTP